MSQRDPRPDATRAPAPGAELDAGALEVIRRAAGLPDGLALLERAPLECVAVLLALHPRAVERGRSALEHPDRRRAALTALAHERRPADAAPSPPARRTPSGPVELIRDAEGRPGGLALLASASPESAAILFGVRPDVVLAARALLAARGHAPHGGSDA